MSIQLKPNTYYKTRDGRKAFIGFQIPESNHIYPWIGYIVGTVSVYTWAENGSYNPNLESPEDLIAEWTEPKLRAWKPEEVPLGAVMKVKRSGYRSLITETWDDPIRKLWLEQNEHSLDKGKTWLPCGVME